MLGNNKDSKFEHLNRQKKSLKLNKQTKKKGEGSIKC